MKKLPEIIFTRLTNISLNEIVTHMSDPRVAEHMPLLNFEWTLEEAQKFVDTKEASWSHDGLGHWAILYDGVYIGWGGFQKEGEDWDFGLVLKPKYFGLGMQILRKAIKFAKADPRINFVTFLLPPSRKKLGALNWIGASFVEDIKLAGTTFYKFRLNIR